MGQTARQGCRGGGGIAREKGEREGHGSREEGKFGLAVGRKAEGDAEGRGVGVGRDRWGGGEREGE